MKKSYLMILLVAGAAGLVGCQKQATSEVIMQGRVTEVDSYGQLHPSFSAEEIEAAGVTYGDLLEIQIGEKLVIEAPYVDAYTEAGSMSPCLCNYNKGDDFGFGIANGSFAHHVGGKEWDTIIVRMKEKEGYKKEYNLLQGTYTYEREDYSSDEVFANFREIRTKNMRPGTLYRSTSPISFSKNKVRYAYTAELCHQKGIQTIIDIADKDEKIAGMMEAEENKGSYMQECYRKGNIVGLGSNADYLDSVYMQKLAHGMREMMAKPAPYLIHCNEGKDRTGFYCLLLEALCGATVEEIKEDYMQTFVNLYHQTEGSEQYELTWKKNGFRMLWLIAHMEAWEKVIEVEWEKCEIEGVDLSEAAARYMMAAGMTEEEVEGCRLQVVGRR